MRELMLELLTYEPYGKFLPVEKIYIDDILSGNCQQPQPMLHDLFSGFHQYVQRANFEEKSTRDTMKADIDWLLCWKNTYHQNKNYTHSSKAGRVYYPLLFKKICFYIIVRKKFTDKEFMGVLGLPVNHISKWGISTKFRRYAETNSYSIVRTFRAGAKKPYIVSLVKKLYYEAGRQDQEGQDSQKSKQSKKSKSMTLKKLPTFVDVFAGTASVAASMVSKGCPPPIVNDYDIVMVCFAWAFTYYQHEIRREIVEFHNYLRRDLKLTDCSYDEAAYERHNEKIAPGNLLTDPNAWDDLSPRNLWLFTVVYKYSKKDIEDRKRFAQRHQEFIMRTRSGYKDVGLVLKSCNRSALRDIDFNNLPLPKDMSDPQKGPILRDILDYALALFFYYSFAPQHMRSL